jgi:formylglycine-generating enzyme required for sulfatase activity
MPIDFTQIETGEDFELLCEDLLQAMGFIIEAKPARGADLGIDLVVTETLKDTMRRAEKRTWVVQCKHYAGSGKSVYFNDVRDYREAMDHVKTHRYLLITSTIPAQGLRDRFEAVTDTGDYVALIWSANDLTRFLDAHPDVRQRHFPAVGPTPADELADTVEALLKVMGFTCHERQPAGDRVRLVCTSKGALSRPAAVVCKEGTVSGQDVEALLANVNAQGLSGGTLVTHTRVTPAARGRATETDGLIQAFTLDAFYRELIDFESYVRQLVAEYDESELATYYVDLGCRTADGSEIKPMDGYVSDWLDDPARNHISILGDYGTGKTSFCRQYAAKLGRQWLSDPDRNRIPILISLRDYAKTMGLQQLITDFLVNWCDIQAKYDAFARFSADGQLVLLFDGFDEMAQKVDYQTTVDNFEELAKAVLWGETSEILGHLPDRPLINLTDRPNFEIVHLLPFDDADIRAILRKRFPAEWKGFWHQIQETYNLEELAQRPVLLDMIACSLPDLEPGQALNAAKLYEVYTNLWLKRDWEKGRHLITRDDKRLFMQALALEMLRREELNIHYSKLPQRVQEHFGLEKEREVDYFDYDIRTCSFLNRDPDGNYQFLHKSFSEFFVAQWLAPKLLDGSAPEMRINEEVRGFVRGLLADADWPPEPPEGVEVPEGMVWVPAGPFIMGGEYGFDVQVARLDRGFFIARTPVTNAEYARFVEATGHKSPKHWRGRVPSSELCDHPVMWVSWDDAAAYAAWAGGRLPAEEEWEKAARGIDGRLYPWGDGFDPARCNSQGDYILTTTPVGRYSPGGDSPCGCVDMAGNVLEWTAGESAPGSENRMVRGGAYIGFVKSVRCDFRANSSPNGCRAFGFRVCVLAQQD